MTADLYRHLGQAALEDFGGEARQPIWSGLRRYGHWHGEKLAPGSIADLVRRWPSPEVRLAMLSDALGSVTATDVGARITLRRGAIPQPLLDDDVPAFLSAAYIEAPLEGIAVAVGTFDSDLRPSADRAEYVLCLAARGADPADGSLAEGSGEEIRLSLGSPSAARALQIETMRCRGAMFVCVARALIDRFDAAGERAVRTATRRYATERGLVARAKHLAEGVEINLKNFVDDYDNPMSVWGWEDGAILTPGRWHATCNFCPHVSAWQELGELELGQLYDFEVHVSLFTSYDPETRVQWDELQSRGDLTCQFRFEIPRLLAADEDAFAGHSSAAGADEH
jgi:L-2-amino-thiazoline-4-carboxylic acid hydrolase